MHRLRDSAQIISAETFQVLTWFVMRITFLFVGRLEVTGWREHVAPLKKGVIFASNHANDMDPIFLRVAMPLHSRFSPLFFVTHPFKAYSSFDRTPFVKVLYKLLPFGWIGAVPMVNGAQDYAVSLENHQNLLMAGRSVCIFPEGQVTKTGELGEPHGGVMFLGSASRAPIVPITITGTFALTRHKFFLSRPHVHIHFGKPQYAADLVPDSLPLGERYREGAKKLFAYIRV